MTVASQNSPLRLSIRRAALGAALSVGLVGAAAAETYASFSAGVSLLRDSRNDGAFTSGFLTGTGTTIPPGTSLPAGASLGWTTEFESGRVLSGALGKRLGALRGEIEIAHQRNSVDRHFGLAAAGIALGGEDAGVLISGSPALGVSVSDLIADGQGRIGTLFLMANAYYDFSAFGFLRPYLGAGIGFGRTSVEFRPSGVDIIDDSQLRFAYQGMAGASIPVGSKAEVFGGWRYRRTSELDLNVNLVPARLDVQNRGSIFEAGLRFTF